MNSKLHRLKRSRLLIGWPIYRYRAKLAQSMFFQSDVRLLYISILIGIKKLFVSCNPTLTSYVFSALPTPNHRKTCIKHTFLIKKNIKKKSFTDLPTLFFPNCYWKRTFFFLGLARVKDAKQQATFFLQVASNIVHQIQTTSLRLTLFFRLTSSLSCF